MKGSSGKQDESKNEKEGEKKVDWNELFEEAQKNG